MSVLDTLLKRHLVLLSPKLWDDKNDSYYIEEFARKSGYFVVLAMCLTAESETYHHWRIFARASGACIVFHKHQFLAHIRRSGLMCQPVIYRTNLEMKDRMLLTR